MNNLPSKDLLEKNKLNEKFYNLSKLTYKKDLDNKLLFPIGIDSNKEKYFMDLKDISGLLIVGETGSGKSNFLNSIIISLLLKNTEEDLRFIFVDPRNVEFNNYNVLPHLIANIYDTNKFFIECDNIIREMERRRDLFASKLIKNISDYNNKNENKLNHIILVIDEASEMLINKDIIDKLNIILTDGYKFGIHILLSTSSYLKNNVNKMFINRFKYTFSFDLANKDQADFLGIEDANLLSVNGDAFVKCKEKNIYRIQTPFVSENDIKNIVDFYK